MSEFGGSSTSSTSSPSAGQETVFAGRGSSPSSLLYARVQASRWMSYRSAANASASLRHRKAPVRQGFLSWGSAANGLAGDAVAVAVHLDAIARLAGVEWSLAESADLFAARVDGALLDRLAGMGRACFA